MDGKEARVITDLLTELKELGVTESRLTSEIETASDTVKSKKLKLKTAQERVKTILLELPEDVDFTLEMFSSPSTTGVKNAQWTDQPPLPMLDNYKGRIEFVTKDDEIAELLTIIIVRIPNDPAILSTSIAIKAEQMLSYIERLEAVMFEGVVSRLWSGTEPSLKEINNFVRDFIKVADNSRLGMYYHAIHDDQNRPVKGLLDAGEASAIEADIIEPTEEEIAEQEELEAEHTGNQYIARVLDTGKGLISFDGKDRTIDSGIVSRIEQGGFRLTVDRVGETIIGKFHSLSRIDLETLFDFYGQEAPEQPAPKTTRRKKGKSASE